MEIGKAVPNRFIQGDTVKFTIHRSDYLPVDGWVMSLSFVALDDKRDVTATDSGDGGHLFTISATDSAAFTKDRYSWQMQATFGGERYTVDSGAVDVRPDYSLQAAGRDIRTQAQRTLDAINATLEQRATTDQLAYTIAGRSLSRIPIPDLITMRDKYVRIVADEENAERLKQGRKSRNTIRVRFA